MCCIIIIKNMQLEHCIPTLQHWSCIQHSVQCNSVVVDAVHVLQPWMPVCAALAYIVCVGGGGDYSVCFARCLGTLLCVRERDRERVNMCRCVHQHIAICIAKHITGMWLSCYICQSLIISDYVVVSGRTDCMCVLQHCVCLSLFTHRLLPPDYQHFTFHHLSCTVPLNESELAGPLCSLHDGIAVLVVYCICVCVYT